MTPKRPEYVTFNVFGEECVDMDGAATRRRVSRAAIWLACKTARLKHYRVAGRIYIPISALDADTPQPAALKRGKAAAEKKLKAAAERKNKTNERRRQSSSARTRRRLPPS